MSPTTLSAPRTPRWTVGPGSLNTLDFGKCGGLLPAVVQHAGDGSVLMLGYMNHEALEATLDRRHVVFFSRARGALWEKGETSGHTLELVEVRTDCDRDALLLSVLPRGPTCHLGSSSCFGCEPGIAGERAHAFLGQLEDIIAERIAARPEGSYTAKLMASGTKRMAQKVGEEGLEFALAAVNGTDSELVAEASDLLYHMLVVLKARNLNLTSIVRELAARHVTRRR